jgi:hypothetical protein
MFLQRIEAVSGGIEGKKGHFRQKKFYHRERYFHTSRTSG